MWVLLADAFSEAFSEFESLAARVLSEAKLWLAARFALELLVFAAVPAVVLVALPADVPLEAVMLSDVVPVEAEWSAPLVPLLL